jgi:mRNA interferase RelE/StbE
MPASVEIADHALDTLYDLDHERRDRIVRKIEDAADHPDHYLDPLTNLPRYKLRVGDFRVVVDWDRGTDTLYVVAVLERKHDYRELPSLREVWGTWRE